MKAILLSLLVCVTTYASDFVEVEYSDQILLDEAARVYDEVADYENTQIQIIKSKYKFKKNFPLTLVRLDRSQWPVADIIKELRWAEDVFAQCEVSFSPITYITTSFLNEADYNYMGSDSIFFDERIYLTRPIFIIDQYNRVPELFRGAGYANPRYYVLKRETVNSTFLFYKGYLEKLERQESKRSYSLLGHELAHNLFNAGHNQIENNILAFELENRRDEVTPEQCAYLQKEFY